MCTRNRLGCARENNLVVHADEDEDEDDDDADDDDDDDDGDMMTRTAMMVILRFMMTSFAFEV